MATRKKSGAKKPAAKAAGKARAAKPPKPAARPAVPKRKEPQTLRLRTFTPGFTVNDIARSVAWYRDVLGFTVADEWRDKGVLRGAEMKAGAVRLYLGQDDWRKGTGRSKGAGFRLYCTTAQDVDRIAALVKSRGGVLAHEPQTQPWGERDFGLVDPDGFNITITGG
jgi:uncharacterized glyoxalase superfamily protein PhnB